MPDQYTGSDSSGYTNPDGSQIPLLPIPDRLEPINFPYRGAETHGVPVEQRPWIPHDASEQSWEGAEVYDPAEPPLKPVPVYVVTGSSRAIRSWRAWRNQVTDTSRMIAGQNPNRTRLHITNLDDAAATIYISHDSNANVNSAFPIEAGITLILESEEQVYGITDTASIVEIALLSEHSVI